MRIHTRKDMCMGDLQDRIKSLTSAKESLIIIKDDIADTKGDKSMSGWVIALIVIAAVIVGLFVLTFLVYMFNLDMRLMAFMEKILLNHYDKVERDEHL